MRDYVDVANSADLERLKALIHPKALACIDDQRVDLIIAYPRACRW